MKMLAIKPIEYDQTRPDRDVILRLWYQCIREPGVMSFEGNNGIFTHQHPRMAMRLVRGYERETSGGWTISARFEGRGWGVHFTHRRRVGQTEDSIDIGAFVGLATENDFDEEWTLATLMA